MSGGSDSLDSEPDEKRNCLDQVMYVAYNDNEKKYSICIAGTKSNYGWRELNLKVHVDDMEWWEYGNAPADAKIAQGIWQGLQNLLGMTATDGVPGVGTTLEQFLSVSESIDGFEEVEVVTNGISLGGALSPSLALWLQDTQTWAESFNVTISTLAFAGPMTGNEAFKKYSDRRLPDTNRLANDLDVVPYAWEHNGLDQVRRLYEPYIPVDRLVRALLREAKGRTGDDVYLHVGQKYNTHILLGLFNKDLIRSKQCSINSSQYFGDFLSQMAYQHVKGYWRILNGPPEFDSVVEQVQEQFNEQVQAYLPELMEYANSQ